MSKTKAVIAAELAAAKRTIMDLRDEATGWHQRAKRMEDEIAGMSDKHPWAVAIIAFVTGLAAGWLFG